jgi:hypothetical protein
MTLAMILQDIDFKIEHLYYYMFVHDDMDIYITN